MEDDDLRISEMEPHQFFRVRRIALGMSQKELAAKVGTTQSAISAIESGRRPMSASMQEKLRDALRTHPAEMLARHRDRVIEEAAKEGFCHLRVFGSVARGEATDTSDVDLFVEELPGTQGAFRYFRLERRLQNILSVTVDVKPYLANRGIELDERTAQAIQESIAV